MTSPIKHTSTAMRHSDRAKEVSVVTLSALRQPSPASDHAPTHWGWTLQIPGREHIQIYEIGSGSFASVYGVADSSSPVVYILTLLPVQDKDILAQVRNELPQNPHLPSVSWVGETFTSNVYEMPFYKTPLTQEDSPTGWEDYQKLRECWRQCYRSFYDGVTGHMINEMIIVRAEELGVSASVLSAIRALSKAAAERGDEFTFEFSPENLASDSSGNIVLLDPLYNRSMLRDTSWREA